MAKLLIVVVFSILLLVPLVAQDAFAVTKTWDGGGAGSTWEDPLNWNPDGVPAPNDDVVLDVNDLTVSINSAVTVGPSGSITLSPTGFNNNIEVNGPSGSLTIFGTFTMNNPLDDIILRGNGGIVTVQCSGVVTIGNGMILVTLGLGGKLVNHGTITGTATNNIVISSFGLVQNSGILPAGIVNNGGTLQTIPSICNIIGGEIIPIETTSLLLAGTQTFSWMIPVVLSVLGIGLFVVSRKSE